MSKRRRVSFADEEPSSKTPDEVQNKDSDGKNSSERQETTASSFDGFALDERVEKAVQRIGWQRPTPVQSAVVPAAMSGRDLLVCAPTGSGKTAAYGIPLANYLCSCDNKLPGTRVLVLAPTRELVTQVAAVLKSLLRFVDGVRVSTVLNNSRYVKSKKKKKDSGFASQGKPAAFNSSAGVLVGTPTSLSDLFSSNDGEGLENLGFIVVDEADLVLGMGSAKDARRILSMVPSSVQSMLLSATLDASGMQGFSKVMLRNPLTVKVSGAEENGSDRPAGITHYFAKLGSQRDRFLVAYAMLRLKVLTGKILIFVNHINAGFKLKLFMDQFNLKTVVLNSELPLNSRLHCVEQFNSGSFNVLIATDELGRDAESEVDQVKKDGEYGVTRGVDFKTVSAVLNFDVPDSSTTYTHRAGRTARAGLSGTVLTLVVSEDEQREVDKIGSDIGTSINPLAFRMDQIEAFRYRVEDCLRMVTDAAVTSARLTDAQREIVNSTKLKDYFDENPDDLNALQHDLSLAKNVPAHLAHIPSYLLPPALREESKREAGAGSSAKGRKSKGKNANRKKRIKSRDPLTNSKPHKRQRK